MCMDRIVSRYYVWIALMLFLFPAGVFGQDEVKVPYYCSFEDAAENAKWVLNAGSQGSLCNDRWVVSSSTSYDGLNALYISANGGVDPVYGVGHPNLVVAYRSMVLPLGIYDVSFDWKNMATDNGGMYVCVLTENEDSVSNAVSGNVPAWVTGTAQWFASANGVRSQLLRHERKWRNESFQLPVLVPDRRVKLAFVWVNSCVDSLNNRLSACVDNIQITSAKCKKPYDFMVESSCDSIYVTWKGVSASYELEYRMRGSKIWRKVAVQDKEYTLRNIQEGGYDFRVRGISNNDTSAYASNYSAIVFCPENHCINYVDLTQENGVKCYTGMAKKDVFDIFGENKVDLGPDDMESRHTVYWAQGQYDPRTGNKLLTVPDGEVASVRLGNWKSGAEAERLEYEFTVDSVFDILLMKYAIVLEDPEHKEDEQPKFTLEILDEYGDLINPTCGVADFYADRNRAGWNTYVNAARNTITWKDWTIVGLNLRDYRGTTLTIRLTTRDCTLSGHYGYAYLTLDCTEGEIKGTSCGDDPQMELVAPEGFDYLWTNSADTSFRSTKRVISVNANDMTTYYCRCSFTENKKCFFDLSTVVEPRFPKASFSYEIVPENCNNVVKFKNESRIVVRKDGVETEKDAPCEEYVWVFGDGGDSSSEVNPEYIFPREGGTFPVTLVSSIASGGCVDDTIVMVTVEPLYETHDTIRDTICSGDSYIFCEQYLMKSDTVECIKYDVNGCDSTTLLYLTVLPPIDDVDVYDTICFGETYTFYGTSYTQSGTYEHWIENSRGCKGVEVLHLTVRDKVTFGCSHNDVTDTPNTGCIIIDDAPDGYTYSLNGEIGVPLTGLSGGEYIVVVYDSVGCASEPLIVNIFQSCLDFELGDFAPVCSGDGVSMATVGISDGIMSRYSVRYGDKAKIAGFVDTTMVWNTMAVELILPVPCRPNNYDAELILHDEVCGDTVVPINFTVNYSADIVKQKWNDVLAVTNATYNGGYDFKAFQWYRNDVPMSGEIGPYIYVDNDTLRSADEYFVMLTRVDDGVTLPTCPIVPVMHADVFDYPRLSSTVLSVREVVYIENIHETLPVRIFDVTGKLCMEAMVDEYNYSVVMPAMPGIYLMILGSGNEQRSYKLLVR